MKINGDSGKNNFGSDDIISSNNRDAGGGLFNDDIVSSSDNHDSNGKKMGGHDEKVSKHDSKGGEEKHESESHSGHHNHHKGGNALEKFDKRDKNGDGVLTKEEAGKKWQKYEKYDLDGDGKVTKADILGATTQTAGTQTAVTSTNLTANTSTQQSIITPDATQDPTTNPKTLLTSNGLNTLENNPRVYVGTGTRIMVNTGNPASHITQNSSITSSNADSLDLISNGEAISPATLDLLKRGETGKSSIF